MPKTNKNKKKFMEGVLNKASMARMEKGSGVALTNKRDHYESAHMSEFGKSLKEGEKRIKKRKQLRIGGNAHMNDVNGLFRVF